MKKNEIKVGGIYKAKVNGRLTTVKVLDIIPLQTYGRVKRNSLSYKVENLLTSRVVYFRSAMKFIKPDVAPPRPKNLEGTDKVHTVWVYFPGKQVVEKHVATKQFAKVDGKFLGWRISLLADRPGTLVRTELVFNDVGAAVRYGKEQIQGEINELIGKQKAMDDLFDEEPASVSSEQRECEDSPDGKHDFTPDLEYDYTGQTINCMHCGEPQP